MKSSATLLYPFVPSGPDFERALAFFDAIGFSVAWRQDDLAGLRFGGAYFLLQRINVPEWQSNQMITFEVDDLERYWADLSTVSFEALGAKVREPTDFPWGREIHMIDPGGVCWHVRQSLPPTAPRAFPDWEELYQAQTTEALPWYWPAIDPDLEAALERYAITRGRALDQGTGPGTQAIALAKRGFDVTATDVSPAALAYVARKAEQAGVSVHLVKDDLFSTKLEGTFDLVFDRGCFHVIAPEKRADYIDALYRLLTPGGWLMLKTFSHRQPGSDGPYRFTPQHIGTLFGDRFEVVDVADTEYQGQLDPWPKALFVVLRKPSVESR